MWPAQAGNVFGQYSSRYAHALRALRTRTELPL
jgi:hypothetical protein